MSMVYFAIYNKDTGTLISVGGCDSSQVALQVPDDHPTKGLAIVGNDVRVMTHKIDVGSAEQDAIALPPGTISKQLPELPPDPVDALKAQIADLNQQLLDLKGTVTEVKATQDAQALSPVELKVAAKE